MTLAGDIAAMFRTKPEPQKQNKRLSRAIQAIAFESRGLSLAGYRKRMGILISKKSKITSRAAEQMLTGLRRRRALKRLRCKMAKRSRARNR